MALRLCIWAGVVGPILFVVVFTIDGFLMPGYSAVREAVSYLAVGTNGWIQSANFIALGLLLVLFALGFFQCMRPAITAVWLRASTIFLLLTGLGFVMAGLFTSAPPGRPQHPLHTISFEVVFFSLAIACLIIGGQLRKSRAWRGYGWYSLITGLLTIIPPIGNLSSLVVQAPQTPISSPSQAVQYGGLFNRIVIVIAFAWYVVIASRMLSSGRAGAKAPRQ